jgi:hypothetical protein
MVSILLAKLECCSSIYATDGDDDTLLLLEENKESTEEISPQTDIIIHKLLWGENLEFKDFIDGKVPGISANI